MILGYDHAIFLVADANGLDTAAKRFAALGFTVTDRDDEGKETATTAQKLVCFADGSYIEILAIRDAEARKRHRFASLLAQGNGWADHSVHTDDLDGLQLRLAKSGMPFSGPHRHERRLRSGEPWGVKLILPGIGAGHPALPFVIEDIAERELRIPSKYTRHANGVTGTAGVAVAVRDLAAAAPHFETLFGPGRSLDRPILAAQRGLRFPVGRQWLDVLEPPADGFDQGAGTRSGEGMLSLFLTHPEADDVTWLATGRHALAIVPES